MTSDQQSLIGSRVLKVAGTLVLLTVGALLLFAHPHWSLESLVGDDAGYYLAVARNEALGYGASFDRLHLTNGFNPLMTWILIPAFRLLPSTLPLLACYRIAVMVGWLSVLGGLWAFLRTVELLLREERVADGPLRLALGAAVAFYAFFIATKSYYGMDAFLVLLLGGLYLWRVARFGLGGSGRGAVIDGLLLGLAFLARVDSAVLLAVSFGLGVLRVLGRREGLAGLVTRVFVCAAVVAPMIVWNIAHFGTWMPISASLKSSFPALRLHDSMRAVMHSSLNAADLASFGASFLVAAITTLVIARDFLRGRGAAWLEAPRVALTVFTLYVFGRLSFLFLFSRFDVQGSYAILAHTYLALMALWLAARVPRLLPGRVGRHAVVLAALALTLAAAVLLAGKCRTTWVRWKTGERLGLVDEATLGAEIRARTAPGEVIYGGAFGLLGFFADRPWINGDGVANDFEYQRVLQADELPSYLARNHVRYVAIVWHGRGSLPAGPIALTVQGHLYGGTATCHADGSGLVLRVPTYRDAGADVCLLRYVP